MPLELESNEVDFVILALTTRGVDYLTQRGFAALLSDPIAAGPLRAAAFTRADLVGYVRFSLMFAGVTLENWEMRDATDANQRLYGRSYSSDDILRRAGFFQLPKSARTWRDALVSAMREAS